MKSFEFKAFKILYTGEIKRRLKRIITWCAGIFAIVALYMLLFPMVQDMFVTKLETFPPELMEFFGMSDAGGFTNYNTYFASIAGILIIIISAYSVFLFAGTLHDEETSGSVEFLNACPVSRTEIWAAKAASAVTVIAAIIISMLLSALICGAIVASAEIKPGAIAVGALIAFLTALVFGGIGFAAASVLRRAVKPSAVGLGILFGTYLLGYMGSIGPDSVKVLKYLSPLNFMSIGDYTAAAVTNAPYHIGGVLAGLALAAIFLVSPYLFYRKRDL
jgi:ABC-type transport system involved in multi-copper enzyme maturation permease subunit